MGCTKCGKDEPNYLYGTTCWDKVACSQRSKTYENAEMQEMRDCFTTDNEQMRIALLRIMAITGHDHSNPIYDICIEALPQEQDLIG